MWLRWLLLFRNLRHGHYAFIADCFLHFVRLLVVYLKLDMGVTPVLKIQLTWDCSEFRLTFPLKSEK